MSIAMPQFNGEVKRVKNSGAAQQVIGHEAKTATFIWRCLLPFGLRVAGFCPRQLRRCAASLKYETPICSHISNCFVCYLHFVLCHSIG